MLQTGRKCRKPSNILQKCMTLHKNIENGLENGEGNKCRVGTQTRVVQDSEVNAVLICSLSAKTLRNFYI